MALLIDLKNSMKSYKNHKLKHLSKIIYHKFGLTANHLTFLSFCSGLASTYFLFHNHLVFIILMILSILFDVFDGSLAQIEHKKGSGWWLDLLSDRSITFLILLKTYFYFDFKFIPPLLALYLITFTLVSYGTIRLKSEVKYVLMIGGFYGLYFFKFYEYGIYLLAANVVFSLIWAMQQIHKLHAD